MDSIVLKPDKKNTIIDKIDLKFKSSNNVPVERTIVTAADWIAVKELLNHYEAQLKKAQADVEECKKSLAYCQSLLSQG